MLRFVYLWDLPEKLFPSLHSETKGRCKKTTVRRKFPTPPSGFSGVVGWYIWSTFPEHFSTIRYFRLPSGWGRGGSKAASEKGTKCHWMFSGAGGTIAREREWNVYSGRNFSTELGRWDWSWNLASHLTLGQKKCPGRWAVLAGLL